MTAAELYDELQTMFGIGNWSESSGDPWWKARATEIGKLKRMLRSRHCSEDDLHLAAIFARDNQIAITATWELFELVIDARKAAREPKTPYTGFTDAYEEAMANGDFDWVQRLDNVHKNDPAAVAAVLEEYRRR